MALDIGCTNCNGSIHVESAAEVERVRTLIGTPHVGCPDGDGLWFFVAEYDSDLASAIANLVASVDPEASAQEIGESVAAMIFKRGKA
jgi:hypothetical protein